VGLRRNRLVLKGNHKRYRHKVREIRVVDVDHWISTKDLVVPHTNDSLGWLLVVRPESSGTGIPKNHRYFAIGKACIEQQI